LRIAAASAVWRWRAPFALDSGDDKPAAGRRHGHLDSERSKSAAGIAQCGDIEESLQP
jgi:hypothetical protein